MSFNSKCKNQKKNKKQKKRVKHPPNKYLLQFCEFLIRNNIEQQKQDVEMFTPFKKFIYVSAGNKKCPQWILCDVKAEK